MSSPASIRPAAESDAEPIARLSTELGYPADAQAIRQRLHTLLDSRNDRVIVALDSGEVVGWLQAHASHVLESGFRVEIVGLIVSPTVRRRGVGRDLVAEAERWAGSLGAEVVVVRSNAKRTESHSFYPALGYTADKTQVVYRKALAGSP
jgi:GNAT superfamily N-acetyltransferase